MRNTKFFMTILLSVILFFPLNGYSQNIKSMMIGYSSNDLETSVAMGENNYPFWLIEIYDTV